MQVEEIVEHPAAGAAEDQSGGPTCVQDVEVVRAIAEKESRHEGISHRFQRSVGDGENERPPGEQLPYCFFTHAWSRGKRHDCRKHVQDEGRDDQLAVADFVADDSADDDAEAETSESHSADVAEVLAGETEFGGPIVKESSANREPNARGENGHKAAPEQAICIGGHRVGGTGGLRHERTTPGEEERAGCSKVEGI